MALACDFHLKPSKMIKMKSSEMNLQRKEMKVSQQEGQVVKKRCLRCNTLYQDKNNSPTACLFHGHCILLPSSSYLLCPQTEQGEKGLFALAPPHQGIDGEWSDRSGVIVYKWNEKENRPNTGRANWRKRWSCCSEYDENAPPCHRGWHVCYDDGYTLY